MTVINSKIFKMGNSNSGAHFIQYSNTCSEFEHRPLFSRLLAVLITMVIIPGIIALPNRIYYQPVVGPSLTESEKEALLEKHKKEHPTSFSISHSLRLQSSKFSAMTGMVYFILTDLGFCSAWGGFYALELQIFLLTVLVVTVNPEPIPKPKGPEDDRINQLTVVHASLATILFTEMVVLGALVLAYDLIGSDAAEILAFCFQAFSFCAILGTTYIYKWDNVTNMWEYILVITTILYFMFIQSATIV